MSESEKAPLLGSKGDGEQEELTGCGGTLLCNPNKWLHRFVILFFMCFLSFGSYFCFDNPAALQDVMTKDLSISVSQFMQFYSWYSWPNVILCFFGGFLIDRVFGIRLGAVIFSLFVTVGQVIFAVGALFNSYFVMCAGRFVFGIGGESLCVAQNNYASKWFAGKELNFVFGLQLSMARIGSTVNMNVMMPVYNAFRRHLKGYVCLGWTLVVGIATCLFSLICAIIVGLFDKRADRILKRSQMHGADDKIKITDVAKFPLTFWLISVICVAYYVAVFPFIGLGLTFFEMKFDYSPALASSVNSLVYIISAAASPVFGFAVDKTGRNIFWVMGGTLITLGCHALMAFTFITPFVAMSIMGVSYSMIASSLWPLVSIIIPIHQQGTAFGIMQAIQNLGLAVIAIAAGAIVDAKGYLLLEVFFLAWLCLALIAGVLLYFADAATGGGLNSSAKAKQLEREEKERQAEIRANEEKQHVN